MSRTVGITPEKILQTGFAFWPSKILLSAIEMRLFTELAGGPEEFEPLAGRLGLHPRAARDFLDALVALDFLTRIGSTYANTPETDLFLDRQKPSYIGGILEMANNRLYRFWGNLTEALRTGQMQNEARENPDDSFFHKLYADPERLRDFLSAMSGISHGANIEIAHKIPWAKYKTYADVGSAQGDLAVQIALANPHLNGIGYDLAVTAPIFEEYVAANNLSDRVRFQPGDFFVEDLPKVDVITMGHILHDWDLKQKKLLIAKAYAALPEGGAFVVYDAMIDDDRSKNAFGLMMSLNMLIETKGGFDYTLADCIGWMKEAGFREVHAEPLVGAESVAIGIK
ncbi:methyltransferase [Terracidiphilus gabretensis]|uniref:methyltransferase n=1 Tax=Terracidiphilus gabretensis TaxID=1577687 RepID=UPI000AD6C5C9|nr:methyltransferase [Terracidiphilus gabretensis]